MYVNFANMNNGGRKLDGKFFTPVSTLSVGEVEWQSSFKNNSTGANISQNFTLAQFVDSIYFPSPSHPMVQASKNGWLLMGDDGGFSNWFNSHCTDYTISTNLAGAFPALSWVSSYYSQLFNVNPSITVNFYYVSIIQSILKVFSRGNLYYKTSSSLTSSDRWIEVRHRLLTSAFLDANKTSMRYGITYLSSSNYKYNARVKPYHTALQNFKMKDILVNNPTLDGVSLTSYRDPEIFTNQDDLYIHWYNATGYRVYGLYWIQGTQYAWPTGPAYAESVPVNGTISFTERYYSTEPSSISLSNWQTTPSSLYQSAEFVSEGKFLSVRDEYNHTHFWNENDNLTFTIIGDYTYVSSDEYYGNGSITTWDSSINSDTLLKMEDPTTGRQVALKDVLSWVNLKSVTVADLKKAVGVDSLAGDTLSDILPTHLSEQDSAKFKDICMKASTAFDIYHANKQLLSSRLSNMALLLNVMGSRNNENQVDKLSDVFDCVELQNFNGVNLLLAIESMNDAIFDGLSIYQILAMKPGSNDEDPLETQNRYVRFYDRLMSEYKSCQRKITQLEIMEVSVLNGSSGADSSNYLSTVFQEIQADSEADYQLMYNSNSGDPQAQKAITQTYMDFKDDLKNCKQLAYKYQTSKNTLSFYSDMLEADKEKLSSLATVTSKEDLDLLYDNGNLEEYELNCYTYQSNFQVALGMVFDCVIGVGSAVIKGTNALLTVIVNLVPLLFVGIGKGLNYVYQWFAGDGDSIIVNPAAGFDHMDIPVRTFTVNIPTWGNNPLSASNGKSFIITLPFTRFVFSALDDKLQRFSVGAYLRVHPSSDTILNDLSYIVILTKAMKGFVADMNVLATALYGYPSSVSSIWGSSPIDTLVANDFDLYQSMAINNCKYLTYNVPSSLDVVQSIIANGNRVSVFSTDLSSIGCSKEEEKDAIKKRFSIFDKKNDYNPLTVAWNYAAGTILDWVGIDNTLIDDCNDAIINSNITANQIWTTFSDCIDSFCTLGSAAPARFSTPEELVTETMISILSTDLISLPDREIQPGLIPSGVISTLPDAMYCLRSSEQQKEDVKHALVAVGALVAIVLLAKPAFNLLKRVGNLFGKLIKGSKTRTFRSGVMEKLDSINESPTNIEQVASAADISDIKQLATQLLSILQELNYSNSKPVVVN